MIQTQQELERLKTLQESYNDLDDKINVVLPALADKIDNIKLPEIDTTELAKQGENQEATNSKILEEVQNKLTPLEGVLTELNNGKQDIVDAINFMGGNASVEDTLTTLANKIKELNILADGNVFTEDVDKPISIGNVIAGNKITELYDSTSTSLSTRYAFAYMSKLRKATIEKTTTIPPYMFYNCNYLREVYLPQAETITSSNEGSLFQNCSSLIKAYTPKLILTMGAWGSSFANCNNIIDWTIGENFNSSTGANTHNYYNPSTAYSKTSASLCFDTDLEEYGQTFGTNWDKWKWCIINHFAMNLQDRSQEETKFTINLGSIVLSKFDQEMIDAFINRGWNLA